MMSRENFIQLVEKLRKHDWDTDSANLSEEEKGWLQYCIDEGFAEVVDE